MSRPIDPNAAAELDKLDVLQDRIEIKLDRMKPSRVKLETVKMMEKQMEEVQDLTEKYGLGVRSFLRKYPSTEEDFKEQLTANQTTLNSAVEEWENKLCTAIHDAMYPQPSVALPAGTGATPATTQQNPAVQASQVACTTIAKAAVKYSALLNLALATSQDMDDYGFNLDTVIDDKISKLVQKIPKFEKARDKLEASHNEYLEYTAVHKPDFITHDPAKLDQAVNDAIADINNLIADLEVQDEERGLATMLPRKMEKIKWPKFCGKQGENFFKFKESFIKAAKQNMTTRADQISKLRENLSDFPLTLVPESMEDINDAFSRLADTYGDCQKLVNFELKKLEKMAMFPNCDDGSYTVCTRAQAEWLLVMETIMVDLIKMGTDGDADIDLKRTVFGPQTTSVILGKFPSVLKHKMISAAKAKPRTEKLDTFLAKFKEWSKQALDLEKYEPETRSAPKKAGLTAQILSDPQANVFNPPKPLPTCAVCVELQKKQQVSPQLPHLSALAPGCPMFIEMNIVNRTAMCKAINLCFSCMRENSPGHEKLCLVSKLKSRKTTTGKTKYNFTCRDKACYRHMWICSKHKNVNQASMDSKAAELESNHNLKLIHFLGCSNSNASRPKPAAVVPPLTVSAEPALPTAAVTAESVLPPPPKVGGRVLKAAEKKLRKKSSDRQGQVEVVPIPAGDPMFMFQALKGKTNPVNGFYDNGCSNACLRTGIPGTQLKGQVLAKGPFTITGVNDVSITAQDEWLVHLDREDGRKQQLRGVTLDTITGDSPTFNIEKATSEVKADKPTDPMLQNCSLPKCVGGVVDILIGIQYNNIFPQPIHHLPNGLTIYRCVLASHDGAINATIGGPHSSFNVLANEAGGASPLMAHFFDGLKKFKKWGPPSIKSNPMSAEEVEFAKAMNTCEDRSGLEDLLLLENAEEYMEELL